MIPANNTSVVGQQSQTNAREQATSQQMQLNAIPLTALFRGHNGHLPRSLKKNTMTPSAPPPSPVAPIYPQMPSTGTTLTNGKIQKGKNATKRTEETIVLYDTSESSLRRILEPIDERPISTQTPSLSTGTSDTSSDTHPSPCPSEDTVFNPVTRQSVVNGLDKLLLHGPEACVKDLLERGVRDHVSAIPVAMVAKAIHKEISSKYIETAKDFITQLRFGAMGMFREYWRVDGKWLMASQNPVENAYLTLRGVNISGFLGSLFAVGIASAVDIHLCLDLLLDGPGPMHFHRLCALHALIIQANDKLCKTKSAPFMKRLRDRLSGLIWMQSEMGQLLISDTVGTIDGWFATQEIKRTNALQAGPSKTAKKYVHCANQQLQRPASRPPRI